MILILLTRNNDRMHFFWAENKQPKLDIEPPDPHMLIPYISWEFTSAKYTLRSIALGIHLLILYSEPVIFES